MNTETNRFPFKYALALLAAAFFWGTTFAAQSIGAGYVGPFTYLTVRSYIGTLFLLPFIFGRSLAEQSVPQAERSRRARLPKATFSSRAGADKENLLSHKTHKSGFLKRHPLMIAGACCGIFLFLSSALQQYGIAFSSTANASFITAMYVVIVPLLTLFTGKKPGGRIWFSVVLCVAGLYLLCMKDGFSISYGDFFLLLCAVGFSLQIMTVNHFSPRVDGLKLSASQFFTVALLSTVCMFCFERPDMSSLWQAMPSMLYAGIFSNGIAYTCQIIGQRHVNPTVASLIMCLESVFGTLSGWLVLHEQLSIKELAGCVLMFAAILLCTIPARTKS
ncbi:MAG: DMT family transporter [Lachnospiraceae bacterium]|nr:DMT family transporter [Lachnospiraceae bacterium]